MIATVNTSRGHIEARVTSENLPGGRIAVLRINPAGAGQGYCDSCDKELRFDPPPSWERIETLACMGECAKAAGFYPARRPMVIQSTKTTISTGVENVDQEIPDKPIVHKVKRGPCPECGGQPSKGRGWDHKYVDGKYCSLSAEGKLAAKKKAASERPACPQCGGPPGRARGWQHREVDGKPCPMSPEAKLAKLAEERKAARAALPPREPKPPVERKVATVAVNGGVRRTRKPLGL